MPLNKLSQDIRDKSTSVSVKNHLTSRENDLSYVYEDISFNDLEKMTDDQIK